MRPSQCTDAARAVLSVALCADATRASTIKNAVAKTGGGAGRKEVEMLQSLVAELKAELAAVGGSAKAAELTRQATSSRSAST